MPGCSCGSKTENRTCGRFPPAFPKLVIRLASNPYFLLTIYISQMGEDGLQLKSDREARIAARRKRIQDKLAVIRQGDNPGAQEATQQQGTSKTSQQLLESSRRLLRLKHESQKAVTAVRLQGDELENARRQREEYMRQDLRNKLLSEAESSAAANAEVAVHWGAVLQLNVPQDLFRAIEEQRIACEAVIASKDRLIADIRAALKSKDEEYVKLLKRQAADVDTLVGAMSRQLVDLVAAYREELENVERALLQERADLVATNTKEISGLLEARATAEANFTEKYLASVETFAANLEELRHADAEEYQVLKIKLESDIAVLEQHLEQMRATYQLNAEKLEYNYRVLLERDAENTATINQQKRKLSRQHDVLSHLKQKYANTDAKFTEENGKLTDEYKRITEQFKDLQAKFRHFAKIDTAKHHQLWQLQQEEAEGLVKQLLAADRVIHEQQLGWQWQGPDESIFMSPHEHRAVAGVTTATAAAGVSSDGGGSHQRHQVTSVHEDEEVFVQEAAAGGTSTSGSGSSSSSNGGAATNRSNGSAEVTQRLHEPHLYGTLCLLVDEAGFLVEPKAAALISKLPASEGQLVAAEAIVRSLGVTDGAAFDALIDALSADRGAGRAAQEAASLSGSKPPVPMLVHPDDAVLRLKQFVEAEAGISHHPSTTSVTAPRTTMTAGGSTAVRTAAASGIATATSARTLGSALAATTAGALGGFKGTQVVSLRAAEREKKYWERLTTAVSDQVMRVWSRLESQLENYHSLLLQRSEGLAAISSLQQQNDELRMLLNQYLSSKINTELKIPPTATL